MATTTLISVEDYLRTTGDPDCEYVKGVLEERAVPERDHAAWQKVLLRWFADRERAWNIEVFTELRVQVAADEFRIPDVVLLSRQAPREQIITHPPLAVFEILSPSDTMTGMLDKLAAYQQMGIPAIWVIEPRKPAYYLYSSGHLSPAHIFELPGATLTVPMSEFAVTLDR